MTSLVIALAIFNVVLLVERYAFWRILWARIQEREARADKLFDRMLALKGIRPIAEPKAEEYRPRTPVLSQDERDAIEDRIRERLEIATYRNEPITSEEARAEVWASLGHSQPPNLDGD